MSDLTPLIPRQPVPSLSVPLVGGGTFDIAQASGDPFTMVVFYRGLHCPICKGYLGGLEAQLGAFTSRGVEVVALSTDDEERATKAKADWGLDSLAVGYGVSLAKAREWGLYVSTARNEKEPAHFAEPAIYLIRPNGELYFAAVQSMPFARPRFEDILPALDFVVKNDYPGRGEVVTLPSEALAAE